MNFVEVVLLITGTLLAIDTLFSLYYFKYTYFLELKRRYAGMNNLPLPYKNKLNKEIENETGGLRMFVSTAYIPWFIFCFFTKIWLLPIVISILIVLTNLLYRKSYISPLALLFNLVTTFMIFLFTILTIISRFV